MEQAQPAPATPPPQRVLALDVGSRRIGVALSDEGGQFAMPLTTVQAQPTARAIQQIAALVQDYRVDVVVVGLPLTMDGEIGAQAQLVQGFVEQLQQQLAVPIKLFDERLTSSVAEQMLRDMGVKPAKRKQRIDELAATIILQDYLDHTRSIAPYEPPV